MSSFLKDFLKAMDSVDIKNYANVSPESIKRSLIEEVDSNPRPIIKSLNKG